MHRVVVLALDFVVPFDLVTPLEVFRRVRLPDGRPAYQVEVAGPARTVRAGPLTIEVGRGLDALAHADTVVVPGVEDVDADVPEPVLGALRRAHANGARVASVCSGAFVLARTGLLDGRRATTHWLGCDALQRRHPAIDVDPDVLYVDEGDVLTSAGAAAAFDLCLHVVRVDHGAAVAAHSARIAVMPLEREGGQSQFILRPPVPPEDGSLAPLLAWLDAHLHEPLRLEDLAHEAGTSARTLHRRFEEQVGSSPFEWLHRARVRRAQVLLETTRRSVERIAEDCGFPNGAALRMHFRRVAQTTPSAYRRAFRERAAE